jgi:hypothetical protein
MLALRKKIFNGADHPDVAESFFMIAEQYSSLGQHEKALQTLQDTLGKRKKEIN